VVRATWRLASQSQSGSEHAVRIGRAAVATSFPSARSSYREEAYILDSFRSARNKWMAPNAAPAG
jgi:hypothetical protein